MKHQNELMSSLLVMAWMVEARDPYTGGHLWRVSQFARMLAKETDHSEVEIARVTVGGFLHDLGKIGIPDEVLRKPEELSRDEVETMRTHPKIGLRLLAAHPLSHVVKASILGHHERPDGNGYPYRLSLHEIPNDARIVALCDSFDAMTSTRPYRKGMSIEQSLDIIRSELGKQFDAENGEALIRMAQKGLLDDIVGHSDNGIPLHHCPMCGPTLVVTREQQPDSYVYCRSCKGEFRIIEDAGKLRTVATGRMGTPADLQVIPDNELITRLVKSISMTVAMPEFMDLEQNERLIA